MDTAILNSDGTISARDFTIRSPESVYPLGGVKHDTGKAPLSLIPADAISEIAQVFGFGAKKYAPFNWTEGFDHRRLYDALLRHTFASLAGEDTDPESGRDHLAHAGCCVLMLLAHRLRGLGTDDRGPKEKQ